MGFKRNQGVKMADNGDIYIGAGTVFSHITNDAIIKKYIPVLGEAVDQVGGPQVTKYWHDRWKYLQRSSQCGQCTDRIFPERTVAS